MAYRIPRNHGCRITDAWMMQGMRTVILENELLRVVVLVDKGCDIIEFRYKPQDLDYLLHLARGVHNPMTNGVSAATLSPFLDHYRGGWNEILPNGGPSVSYKGAELGEHGEVSLLAWEYTIVEDSPEKIAARFWVRTLRTPLFLEKTLSMQPGKAVLMITEELVNEGSEPIHVMWGQHIAFGKPFLNEGVVLDTPARRIISHPDLPPDGSGSLVPRRFKPKSMGEYPYIQSPDGAIVDASQTPPAGTLPVEEMAYLTELERGWFAVTNQIRQVGFGLHFDNSLFRYLWYWQQLDGAAKGYPWWGNNHTFALEPWTSYPTDGLTQAIQNGSALPLSAGEHKTTQLCAVAYTGFARVHSITSEGYVS